MLYLKWGCINMFSFKNHIEKIAAVTDREREMELIKRVQQNPNDNAAWMELRIRLRKVIDFAISQAKRTILNMPVDALDALAINEFKRSILSYDPSKGQPNTYLISNMKNSMLKQKYENMASTRMSSEKSEKAGKLQNVINILEMHLDRKPTFEEQVSAYNSTYKSKPIDIKAAKDIDKVMRSDLSADINIGTPGIGDNITRGDIMNIDSMTGDDLLTEERQKEKIDRALLTLTPQEKRLFEEYEGLGKYKNKKAGSFAALAFNNHLQDAWEAQRLIREIKRKLAKELK